MSGKRKIAFAYYCPGWSYEGGDEGVLRSSRKVAPDEYEKEMAGNLFCPSCKTNVARTPREKDLFTNQREPFFRHLKCWTNIPCVLRAKKPKGKKYDSWEEAKRAIDHEELTIIKEFLQDKPIIDEHSDKDYDETPIEDADGPLSEVPIGRHEGESFELPSKITTIAGICRGLDKNLGKYFYLPGAISPIKLAELLTDIVELEETILDTEQAPRLYFGKIKKSFNAGKFDHNIRMTRLECNPKVVDFTIKASNGFCRDKGITDDSEGRIVMFYGKITTNGSGLAATSLAWGEIALVPAKYNELLIPER